MEISKKSLEKLRNLINEEIEYRSGPKLVDFFNDIGFSDKYEQGFPSRWQYTDEKLSEINGTPKLEDVIKKLFNPINFIENIKDLDGHISALNQYLTFDKKKVKRENENIYVLDTKEIRLPRKNIKQKNLKKENLHGPKLSNKWYEIWWVKYILFPLAVGLILFLLKIN